MRCLDMSGILLLHAEKTLDLVNPWIIPFFENCLETEETESAISEDFPAAEFYEMQVSLFKILKINLQVKDK